MRTANSTTGNENINVRIAADDESAVVALPGVFEKWRFQLIQEIKEAIIGSRLPEEAQRFIEIANADNQSLRRLLVRALLNPQVKADRKEFLVLQQSMIIAIMNELSALTSKSEANLASFQFGNRLQEAFEATLDFLHQNFPDYFNPDCTLPKYTLMRISEQQDQALDLLHSKFHDQLTVEGSLLHQVFNYLNERVHSKCFDFTYQDALYIKSFTDALQFLSSDLGGDDLRQLLYQFNYNESWFTQWECERLNQQLAIHDAPKERAALLKLEQKMICQRFIGSSRIANKELPSLKTQLNTWIDEEVKFLESGYATNSTLGDGQTTDKIQTSLSVAKLAVIIRLLVIDKIIINRTVAPMLRMVAKVFTSLQRDEISFVSLEAKYHAPEKATVSAVRDMLFKWIKILDKL